MHRDELLIRPASGGDAAPLAALMTELGYPTTEEDMRERFRVIGEEPHYRTFIAEYRGEVVGMAGALKSYYFELNGSYVRLGALVTKSGHRNKGVGSALVEAVEQWAGAIGANAIVLNCGNREERKAAHIFYQRIGFEAKSTGYMKRI
jgi:GNAT superfamily N-acetyltransferase